MQLLDALKGPKIVTTTTSSACGVDPCALTSGTTVPWYYPARAATTPGQLPFCLHTCCAMSRTEAPHGTARAHARGNTVLEAVDLARRRPCGLAFQALRPQELDGRET
eukprot:3543599-Rhodomonas_salina.4